ncbi:FAD synthase [Candidatus Woesearchaeota archaeon]|nr:FAD synthase [Candidatus Woesearchaeota archaeon]
MKKAMCISWLSFFAAPKKVMCFGTFDVLHEGHKFYLTEAKRLGDYLVVVVARDDTVKEVKKRQPLHSESERVRHLQQLGIADKVVLGNPGDKLKVIEDEMPDVICFGYDQNAFTENAKEKLKQRGLNVEVVRLPAYKPEVYKSSLLKKHNIRSS